MATLHTKIVLFHEHYTKFQFRDMLLYVFLDHLHLYIWLHTFHRGRKQKYFLDTQFCDFEYVQWTLKSNYNRNSSIQREALLKYPMGEMHILDFPCSDSEFVERVAAEGLGFLI